MKVNEMFIIALFKYPLTDLLNCEIICNFKRNKVDFHVLKWED